jgi:hypothetical protein
MSKYIVNRTAPKGGYHEVHSLVTSCPRLPLPADRQELGDLDNCHLALAQAKLEYPKANGCRFCCLNAYTK